MKRRVIIIVVCLFYGIKTICCSCFDKGRITVKDFNSYDCIFVGKLISEIRSEERPHERTAVYIVVKAYKGANTDDTVRVCDAQNIGACGLGLLKMGREYLVYANGDKKLHTSDCFRTTLAPNQVWPQDSISINRLKGLVYFGRIYDTMHTNFHADTLFLNRHVLRVSRKGMQRFFDENGGISAEGLYKNGLAEGFWNYYRGGKVTEKGKYLNGKKDSMWVEPFSKEMVYIREYRAGEFTCRERVYYDEKISSKTEPVEKGDKWIRYDYHSNGQARFIGYANPPVKGKYGNLETPVFDGPFKMFNKSGIVLQEGIHKNGMEVGKWRYYYESGKLRMEGLYIDGKKTGLWKIYYPNKKIKAAGEYKDGEKIGTWNYFDKNGKVVLADPKLIEEDEDWFTYSGVKN